MKKIIIIFIIVCCLLYFIEIFCLSEESPNQYLGKAWNNLEEGERLFLIAGFSLGMKALFDYALDEVESITIQTKPRNNLVLKEFMDFRDFLSNHLEAIYKMVDDLYKDPANMYIEFTQIIKIAYQKLVGEDIEPLLQKARKKALQ